MSIEDGHEIHQNRFQHIRVISLFFCFIKKISMKQLCLAVHKIKWKTSEYKKGNEFYTNKCGQTNKARISVKYSFSCINKQELCVGKRR